MASSETHPKQSHSFDPPQESERHRMIAEGACYLAEKRGFVSGRSLDDWLAAEQQVRLQVTHRSPDPEARMNDTNGQNQSKAGAKTPVQETQQSGDSSPQVRPSQSQRVQGKPQQKGVSRYEKFATTQAGGDGIEGDVLKPVKTIDEKLGANMADRK
jgi:Protein of unknown function (DUF2934)